MQIAKKILYILSPHERKQAGLLLVMILIMALLDTIGVVSILPFMAVLASPDLIETNMILNKMFQTSKIFGVENNKQFLIALGILVIAMLVISLSFKALTTYLQTRFIVMREYSVGKRLLEGYLNHPYSWFLNRHSSDLGKNILSEASQIAGNGLGPLLTIISCGLVTIAIIVLLIIADPKLTLIAGCSLSLIYALIYKFTQKFVNKFGKEHLESNQLRFRAVNEAFGAVKEIKVAGIEQIYIKRFSNPAETLGRSQAYGSAIEQLPRFILEIMAFGGIMLMLLYLMTQTSSFNSILPIISLYVFAGYRLIPALQQIYSSLTKLRFSSPALNLLYNDLKDIKPSNFKEARGTLSLNKMVNLKNINYNYPNAEHAALKNININISAKTTVGLVGATGSGKTTMVDIILGLIEAQKGTLEVDGKVVTKQNARSWRRSIGYVPQNIFLSDDTIMANIAFGVDIKDINQQAVEKVAKIANLHSFVIDELPKQYHTKIGERGVRLSGGQRQRIGIARALYHNPQVLIFDEATSALDNQTEKAVMDAVNNLDKEITIILIAHRLSTVKKCDNIFFLENGELKAQGDFNELIKINKNFRSMAGNY